MRSGLAVLSVFFNGSVTAGFSASLTGVLAPQGTFVLAHAGASPGVLARADQTVSAGPWSGDDALVLSAGGTVVDSFGQLGLDPGARRHGG